MSSKFTHEVCIIGAGPVGLALANCLAASPWIKSIAIIDKKIPSRLPTKNQIPNQRVYSINAPTLHLLNKLNILPKVRQSGTLTDIQVISRQSSTFFEWSQNTARIIEGDELVSAMLQNLEECSKNEKKIEFIQDEILSFNHNQYSTCEIFLKNRATQIRTKLLVGSDGNKSKVKEIAKIHTYGWSYRQKAIVCTLRIPRLNDSDNHQAFQIYYEGNVLAILPLWGQYVSIVWSLQIADYEHVMSLSKDEFIQKLNEVIARPNKQNMSAKYKPIAKMSELLNQRLAFPLSTLQAEYYTKHRLALIGDAAHSIHPMLGLGVNAGIFDSVFLANNIILNKKTGNDIGEVLSLSTFESQAKAMNYANSLVMEGVKKSFEMDISPLNWVRQKAIDLLQSNESLKEVMKGTVDQNPFLKVDNFEWEH